VTGAGTAGGAVVGGGGVTGSGAPSSTGASRKQTNKPTEIRVRPQRRTIRYFFAAAVGPSSRRHTSDAASTSATGTPAQ
jgi:hypothetical protein